MDEHQLNDPAHTTAPGSDAASKTAQPEAAEESPQKSVLRRLWDSTGYLLVPLVSVFLLLGVIFSLAWVPTGSMEPTLPTKSYFLGWRLPYFFGDPTPAQGDIVMFRSEELGELLVKRVIGLGGDTITFADGDVYVNGEALEEIAQKAIDLKTGARGLRSVIEDTMIDVMYEAPSDVSLAKCTITKNCVDKLEKPILAYRGKKKPRKAEENETA